MQDLGNLIEGLFVSALGAFMVFAPRHAERINRKLPFVRTAGTLRAPFGWTAFLAGVLWVVVWIAQHT